MIQKAKYYIRLIWIFAFKSDFYTLWCSGMKLSGSLVTFSQLQLVEEGIKVIYPGSLSWLQVKMSFSLTRKAVAAAAE